MTNANGESDVTPTESKTTGTVGHFPHGSRETPAPSVSPMEADRSEKARGHKSDRHVAGESDSSIVPGKPANKGSGLLSAESVEGRKLSQLGVGSLFVTPEEKSGEVVRGVGSVSEIKSETLAWAGAENRARTDLAQNLTYGVAPLILQFNAGESEHSVAGAGGGARTEEEVNEKIREATRRVALRIATSARVVERRNDGSQYSVTVEIGVREARRAFDEADELQLPFR